MQFLKENRLQLIFLLTLAVLIYTNSFNNAFLSDDLAEIANNPNIGNLGYAISTHPFGFIRPLFYWLAFNLGGLNPIFFRFINLFFHLGSIALVYFLVSKLNTKKVALFASSIFAIHPLLTEPVVWISGGSYPQYSFFFLLSFLFYILSSKKAFSYFLSIIFYLLSFMSHPVMPASLILIYPLYELVFGNLAKNWKRVIPFFLISLVYVGVNLAGLPERETTLQSVHYQERGIDNPLVQIPVAVSSYLQLFTWPQDLTLYHSELVLSQTVYIAQVIIFLAFLTMLFFSFKKDKKIFFWLSFFIIGLLPTLTPFRLNWIVAERYVYLGSIGLVVTLAILVDKLTGKPAFKPLYFISLSILILALSTRTFIRNIDWKNEDNLWIATGKTSPSSPNTHNNLGDVYGRRGDKQAALKEFQKAIELKPNYADAYHNLANTYHELGEDDKALENYQKAAELNPNLWQSYQNIAAIYFGLGKYDLALSNMQKAIKVNPKNLQLVNNLGIIYLKMGDKLKAKEVFNAVLSVNPTNSLATQGLIEASK
ncbi:tetratricopeptide repeat protein [Candidatus Daviesbacteria bacterium]|nr:tetratricopeptide repeat protein [Candidatus Daviesbacteria bacterium]